MKGDDRAEAAYAEDVRRCPIYPDGGQRIAWHQLSAIARESWRRNPTPREWRLPKPKGSD